jgi:enamine deaminase RidA (YjgF/YER057c/UK114 family)
VIGWFFPVDPPASTIVELSRMMDERWQVEINAIAVVDGRAL